jgi:hypothetical protein
MLRFAFRTAIAAAFFVLACCLALAQGGPPAHPPRPKMLGPAKWQPSAREISAAYWTLEPGWSTTLEMRNNVLYHDLIVTPVLRSETGQETPLAPVTIAPQHVVSINLRNAAANHANLGSFGSVAFRFNGLNASNLFAATIVRREGEPIDFHFDGEDSGTKYDLGGFEGLWWIPAASSTDYLILFNPAKKAVSGTVALSSAFASHQPLAIHLGPGETKRIDLREVLGSSSVGGVGGLSLLLPGKEPIFATQIIFDEVTGLAAMMKMFDRDPDDQPQNRVLRAPMMALSQPDPGLGFPNGTQLVPRIFLRNAGTAPTQISATVDWRSQSSGTFALPPVTLSPGEVRTISLADYERPGQIPPDANWGLLKLAYTGRRADLVAVSVSYDKTNRYGLQTPFSEELSRLWVGGMWHVDPTHNTFITTGNAGKEPTAAEVTLFYNGGKSKYRMEKMLAPGEQLWLDVGHLVHDQVADSDGNTLPPDTMTGSYELRDLDHAYVGQLYEGKLVVDKTYGHAAYGCGNCCGYNPPYFGTDPFTGLPDFNFTESVDSLEACGGGIVDVTGIGYDWKSSNTAVATLPNKVLHTVAVGNTTGQADFKLEAEHPAPQCPTYVYGPAQQVNVQPMIMWNGANITNTTQSVVTGQQIALSASYTLPSGVSVKSQSWSVGGTTVGGYNASTSRGGTVSTNFSGQSTTFYWVASGNSLNVTFTLNLNGGSQSSATASATFNASGVTSPTMTVQNFGSLTIDNLSGCSGISGGPYLVYGNVSGPAPGCAGTTTGTAGITFSSQGTQPGAGTFFFVQIINSDSRTYTSGSGQVSCSTTVGIDTVYPYPKNNVGNATDAPEAPLASIYNKATRSFNATMYLLWQSSQTGSIPVPLGYEQWQFSGSTTQSGGTWATPSGNGGPTGNFTASGSYPTWTGPATESCN